MSMAVAVSLPFARVIAADTRFSALRSDEQVGWIDHGGKLVRVSPTTWLAFTGRERNIRPVLERIARVAGDSDAVWDVLKAAAATLPPDEPTVFLLAGNRGVGRVCNGRVDELARDALYVSHPPGLGDFAEREGSRLFARLDTMRTPGEVVRAVAQLFAMAAALSPFISPSIDLVVNGRQLSGSAQLMAWGCLPSAQHPAVPHRA